MTVAIAALNSKGGVGKTTLLANLGSLLADMGARVLLVDADPQPSLSKYFRIEHEGSEGLVEVITQGVITPHCISSTRVPNLDLIRSNDGEAGLQHWLHARPDARCRLARALRTPVVSDRYDYVLIDTQGAIGPLQMASAFAADMLVSPLPPDTASLREFRSGTLRVLKRLAHDPGEPRAELAPIKAVICRFDYSRDARGLLAQVRAEFDAGDRVTVLETMIPSAVAYKDAFTARRPVHEISRHAGLRYPSGYEVMHRLVWELQPHLYGSFAGRMCGDPDQVFGPPVRSRAEAALPPLDARTKARSTTTGAAAGHAIELTGGQP